MSAVTDLTAVRGHRLAEMRAARQRLNEAIYAMTGDPVDLEELRARQKRDARKRKAYKAAHGTDSGYYRHLRSPDSGAGWPRTPCEDCRAAHCDATRARQRRAGR